MGIAANGQLVIRRQSRPVSALEKLGKDDPETASKLMSAIALRIAERLRDTSEKLKMYTQLVQAMQQEIDHLMPT